MPTQELGCQSQAGLRSSGWDPCVSHPPRGRSTWAAGSPPGSVQGVPPAVGPGAPSNSALNLDSWPGLVPLSRCTRGPRGEGDLGVSGLTEGRKDLG